MNHIKSPTQGRRIRILRIVTRMNVGGPAVQITNLLENLQPEWFEQRLLYGKCEKGEEDFLLIQNLNYVASKQITTLHRSLNLLCDIRAFFSICREIISFKPEIVHTHMSKAGLLGRLSAILFSPKSKIVHTYHGLIFDGYFDNRKVRVLKTIERILSKKTNVIIAVGSHTRHTLIQERIAQPQKILVINPGIVTPVNIDIRSRNFATQNKINVLWVGRMTKIKRPDRLLDIVRIVNRDNLDFTFRVAGNGPELNELQKISELENLPVAYLGTVKDIDFEFQNCDLVISTSDNEGVPLSLIQAQFHGKPVVSTNVGSVSDIISHGKNGYLTTLEPEEFVKCMLKFSDNREQLRQMGEDARDRAEISFSLLQFIEKYQEMYLNIK